MVWANGTGILQQIRREAPLEARRDFASEECASSSLLSPQRFLDAMPNALPKRQPLQHVSVFSAVQIDSP
jgi:hypothetical protein